jgi:hypothetical protein
MKKILISAGALAALAISTPALAANNQAKATATVNLVSPLTLTNTSGLNFGTLVGPFNGETVRVNTAGSRTCGGLVCSGTVTAANFDVSKGTANQGLTVTVDPSVTLNGSVSGSLTVDLTTDLPSGVTTDGSGNATFGVGGTLVVPSTAVDGLYTGQFNVQVDYN